MDDEIEEDDQLALFTSKEKKKSGRKCHWKESVVEDLVDIILEDEKYKEKLLLTNVKNVKNGELYSKVIVELKARCEARNEVFEYDVKQTRNKFKRCVNACRQALLKVKTASGIKRFQESKDFGNWFQKLVSVVRSQDYCQPSQHLEPSVAGKDDKSEENKLEDTPCTSNSARNTSGKRKLFTPIHETSRKKSKKVVAENILSEISNTVSEIKSSIENIQTKELLEFLKEDSERQARQDDMFLKLMANALQPQHNQMQYNMLQMPQSFSQNVHVPNMQSVQPQIFMPSEGSFLNQLNE